MKRKMLLYALLALSMVIPLASCGSSQQNDDRQNTSQQERTDPNSSEPELSEDNGSAQQDDSQQDSDTSEASVSQPTKTDTDPDHADTQPKIVFEKGGKTFYASKIVYDLTDGTKDAAVMVQSPAASASYFNISSKSMALCGTEFYGVERGSCNSVIWHVYADDTGTMYREMLYTPAQVKTAAEKYCDKDITKEEIAHTAEVAFTNEVRNILTEDYKEQYAPPMSKPAAVRMT